MDKILEIIWARKFAFLGTFFLVFTISYIVLVAVDFLPESPETKETENATMLDEGELLANMEDEDSVEEFGQVEEFESVQNIEAEFPVRISISKLDKSVSVLNPQSRSIVDLDTALLDGAVRHPDSANLTQEGNVFILAHSSYLPNVFNKNFQAFNGIQNLEWGDVIEVYSEDSVFEYRVDKVYRASAQDVTVPIAGEGHSLTLATCNSFGSADDRYIVEAKQVEVRKI